MSHQPSVVAVLRYQDAKQALEFLHDAFGFQQTMVVPGEGNTIAHAEMSFGNGKVMLASDSSEPGTGGAANTYSGVYATVTDPDEHCARARTAGAEITMEPTDMDYGSREYAARDLEGHHWYFGTYQPSVS
ncbi:glyoxalase [Allosaccharopolyspora coralli]|uniref:Glyoxalase n=1 Tax=Allosaccharopolyspora coralli TaxID=2665642 RepID=A0A5Q3Q5K2_9PSEU|nr:VOC family protein [Allosaccharopolyspora coralli]QGK69623.1 glyoxalase [Allosaccharopolyspora coralli]